MPRRKALSPCRQATGGAAGRVYERGTSMGHRGNHPSPAFVYVVQHVLFALASWHIARVSFVEVLQGSPPCEDVGKTSWWAGGVL
eukprot:13502306-Alexandrium_andersonii.AAC.1